MTRSGLFFLVFLICLQFIAGCATPPPKVEVGSVFYPEPPALPRVQYLASFTSSQDIEPGKSAFDVFLTGQEGVRRLDKPYGVVMHNGKIYVADSNETVMVFDLEKKTFEPLRGAQGMGKLIQPLNIAVDREGNKYVADPVRGQVVMFDKNDFYVKAYGTAGDWRPTDVATYEDRLYVADAKNAEVKVFDKATGEVRKIIGKGDPKESLSIPTNVAFDKEGYLYVSDAGRFQVLKYDRDGHLRGTVGKLGANLGHFARPRGIAIDREGRLFAVDAAFDNVQIFNKDGRLLFFFGKAGDKPGDLFLPAKVFVDYDNVKYFQHLADSKFEIESLVFVTSQFGDRMVNVYAYGKEKGRKYPTEEELIKEVEEKIKKLQQEEKKTEKTEETEKGKETK